MRIASAVSTRSRSAQPGANSAAVAGSSAARRESISTAVTARACGSRARVSEPSPGPTSSTTSSGPTSAVRTMRRTVPPSTTKFWPSVLVGRTPVRSANRRTSAGVSSRAPPEVSEWVTESLCQYTRSGFVRARSGPGHRWRRRWVSARPAKGPTCRREHVGRAVGAAHRWRAWVCARAVASESPPPGARVHLMSPACARRHAATALREPHPLPQPTAWGARPSAAGLRRGAGGRVRRALGGKLAHSLHELRPIAAAHPLAMPDPERGPTPWECPVLGVVQPPGVPGLGCGRTPVGAPVLVPWPHRLSGVSRHPPRTTANPPPPRLRQWVAVSAASETACRRTALHRHLENPPPEARLHLTSPACARRQAGSLAARVAPHCRSPPPRNARPWVWPNPLAVPGLWVWPNPLGVPGLWVWPHLLGGRCGVHPSSGQGESRHPPSTTANPPPPRD